MAMLLSAPAFAQIYGSASHEQYNRTVFDDMPHAKIMEIAKQKCHDDAMAAGVPDLEAVCNANNEKAYTLLKKANDARLVPDLTWRLCVGQANDGLSYDYPLWARCMKAAVRICTVDDKGDFLDKLGCVRMIQSAAWVRNPVAQ